VSKGAARCELFLGVLGEARKHTGLDFRWYMAALGLSHSIIAAAAAETTQCFEGPEKNLEVVFKNGNGNPNGCRQLDRSALDTICGAADCSIISHLSNAHLDAYILTDSSLFVYKSHIVLKTYGQTTLLRCLDTLFRLTAELGLELEWLGYSRKNYVVPDDQEGAAPAALNSRVFTFEEEFAYLKSHPELAQRLGSGYILGPVTGDHWLAYALDQQSADTTERTVNIMMFDLDPTVAAQFYTVNSPTAKEMTTKSGIANLVPGAVIDDRAFEPCGYSMNAILHDSYATVHVTPDGAQHYAAFETDASLRSYTSLVNNVLAVFRPERVVITMYADPPGQAEVTESPVNNATIMVPTRGLYTRCSNSFTKMAGDLCVSMGTWEFSRDQSDMSEHEHRKANRTTTI